MEQNEIKGIILGDETFLIQAINKFTSKYNQTFSFPELNQDSLRKELWSAIFRHLNNKQLSSVHVQCLSIVRILSRDKTNLNELICNNWIETLLYHSRLQVPEEILIQKNIFPNYPIIIEALKCLCNIVFNSEVAQAICSKNGTLEGIMKRLLTYRDPELPNDVKYFDMKLMFIITALCAEIRPMIKDELHGITYLIETLDLILKGEVEDNDNISHTTSNQAILSVDQVNIASEILKILFNLTIKSNFYINVDEEEEAHFLRLVTVLHDLLLVEVQPNAKKSELHNHVINLLTCLPVVCFKELVTTVQHDPDLPAEMEYEGYNMSAVHALVKFLESRLNSNPNVSRQHELLSPVLTVLIKCVNSTRIMRKYLRMQILPPLKDVHNRPEQGSTLRNHLCRLLTTPVTQVRDLVADFLFTLCKENVARMVKYTGYGNAAGLFANRGLMGGRTDGESRYSSDSEDSDTEEYKEYKHGINPVMGCYEPPKPDPTAEMTEEQKEYEAMKLVELMDNLTRKGIVHPCRIGEDGRPEPIEHVLQLQEELPKQQIRRETSSP